MIDKKIVKKIFCNGCHACYNICHRNCISMVADNEGFNYPKVDYDLCTNCNLCIQVCPLINKTFITNRPTAYAAINKNETVRLNSSSGGIFTLISEQVIQQQGVVFGALFDKEFNVIHGHTETKKGLSKFRGSKYVQSDIGYTYRQVKYYLNNGKKVLFSGTPCQIGGLKSYLSNNYDNLLCVDFICHGVPSPKVWRKYINYRETFSYYPTLKISFREKSFGWKNFSIMFLFKNNNAYKEPHQNDLYMNLFLKDICLRPSCHNCQFKTLNRESDITLADFWGVQNLLPEFYDNKGTSLLFVNSNKGQLMINDIQNRMTYKKVDIDKAILRNPSAIKSVKPHHNRDNFFRELDASEFHILAQKCCIN